MMSSLFDPAFSLEEEKIDPVFKLLRDDPRCEGSKSFAESLWQRYEPYADRDFQSQIARQFHNRFWEMYLACTLMVQGHKLVDRSWRQGPDICIDAGGPYIWVEAVAPGKGQGPDAVPSPPEIGEFRETGQVHVFAMSEKLETEIILRYCSAIGDKNKKYSQYRDQRIIDETQPFVVAVNGAQVPYSYDKGDVPFIVKAVLPFGVEFAILDWERREITHVGHSLRPEVSKVLGAKVPTNIFLDPDYAGISAVLFSKSKVGPAPEKMGTDFILIHNPKAANPLPHGWLKLGSEYRCIIEPDRLVLEQRKYD